MREKYSSGDYYYILRDKPCSSLYPDDCPDPDNVSTPDLDGDERGCKDVRVMLFERCLCHLQITWVILDFELSPTNKLVVSIGLFISLFVCFRTMKYVSYG